MCHNRSFFAVFLTRFLAFAIFFCIGIFLFFKFMSGRLLNKNVSAKILVTLHVSRTNPF